MGIDLQDHKISHIIHRFHEIKHTKSKISHIITHLPTKDKVITLENSGLKVLISPFFTHFPHNLMVTQDIFTYTTHFQALTTNK